jgi:hypothetical protein
MHVCMYACMMRALVYECVYVMDYVHVHVHVYRRIQHNMYMCCICVLCLSQRIVNTHYHLARKKS